MSAWDDPITHIRELEAEVSRLRKVVERVEEVTAAAEYRATTSLSRDFNGNLAPGWVLVHDLRDALEVR